MAAVAAPTAPRRPSPPTITSLADFEESINIMIYGDPGAGKTPLAGTCPDGLFLATEPGTISAKRAGSRSDLARAYNFREFKRTFLWLRDVAVPSQKYKWLMVDSATRMQEMVMRDILDEVHKENPHRDPDIPDVKEHQKWQQVFKKYVNAINDLPINVLWTAHAMRSEDQDGEPLILPMFSGRNGTDDPKTMSMWMSGTVSLLGYLGVNEEDIEQAPHRRLVIQRAGPYIAKDRFDLGVPWIDNPNMAEIQARIEQSGGAKPAPARTRRGTR